MRSPKKPCTCQSGNTSTNDWQAGTLKSGSKPMPSPASRASRSTSLLLAFSGPLMGTLTRSSPLFFSFLPPAFFSNSQVAHFLAQHEAQAVMAGQV